MSAGYNQPYAPPYDQAGFAGNQDVSVKARLINLIGAVRTLMRSKSLLDYLTAYSDSLPLVPLIGLNLVIILYELILGG